MKFGFGVDLGYHACRDTRFCLATLGNDTGAYGAFQLIADQ